MRTACVRAANTALSSTLGRTVVVSTGITVSVAAAGSRSAATAAATTGSASASRPVRARPTTTPFFVIAIVALTG